MGGYNAERGKEQNSESIRISILGGNGNPADSGNVFIWPRWKKTYWNNSAGSIGSCDAHLQDAERPQLYQAYFGITVRKR